MKLSELKNGEIAIILKVKGHGGFRRRIMEMGFVRGQRVEIILNAPLQDPIDYRVMGYDVSLRRSEADMIEVVLESEAEGMSIVAEGQSVEYSYDEPTQVQPESEPSKREMINVALIGNPNSGKTSLFNSISGRSEHVGNYSGVTVDAKRGYCNYRGYRFEITDLPGTYALSAYTPEEIYVRKHIAEKSPDVVINAVVASNLERNLYLTTELIDINPRAVISLNMYDELESSGAKLDYDSLGRMLGIPMVPVVSRSGQGVKELLDTVIAVYENRDDRVRHIHINQGVEIEGAITALSDELYKSQESLPKHFPPRYLATKLLERDKFTQSLLESNEQYEQWSQLRDRLVERVEQNLNEDIETELANRKYGFISGAIKEVYTPGGGEEVNATKIIDTIVTHKLWGFPIFLGIMWLMFWATFTLGAYPQDWIDMLVGAISGGVDYILPDGPLKDMIADGIIGGVGSVIVFLPNIMILYLFISFMEDSGYLARAAFIMDRIMHRIGLHGKSFIPLIMGFGCNVPAIMATRTIESRSSRLITILISPFISCSARLPIFILLVGAFFPENPGFIIFMLYVIGVALAVITARLIRRFLFTADETPFVMELPPYRMPTTRSTLKHMWAKCTQYLRKMGGMILIASIIVWALSYYPQSDAPQSETEHYEQSYLGQAGKLVEPIFSPFGLDWKASVALMSGVAAKEVVVSTLGVLYAESDVAVVDSEQLAEDDNSRLESTLVQSGDFNTASAFAFLIFILIYFPCIATVVAIAAEAGRWWAAASMLYNTALAWVMSYGFYKLILLFM